MSWYRLSEISSYDETLCARFVPDTLAHAIATPILEVKIVRPADRDAAITALECFIEEFVAHFSHTACSFTMLGDMDLHETTIHAGSVDIAFKGYTTAELLEIAKSLESAVSREASYGRDQSRKLNELTHFVKDLINRAETRQALSTQPSKSLKARIDVLTRVLNRIGKDKVSV